MDETDIDFQQDERRVTPRGKTCHFCATILRGLISQFGEWPARSLDLSTLDFFLSGHLEEKVYRDDPLTLTEVKEGIGKEIRCIRSEVTKAVCHKMKKRAQDCIQSGGHHLINFVFNK